MCNPRRKLKSDVQGPFSDVTILNYYYNLDKFREPNRQIFTYICILLLFITGPSTHHSKMSPSQNPVYFQNNFSTE